MTTSDWIFVAGFTAGCIVGIFGYYLYTMIRAIDIPEHKEEI